MSELRALKVLAGAAVPVAVTIVYFYLRGALGDIYRWTLEFPFSVFIGIFGGWFFIQTARSIESHRREEADARLGVWIPRVAAISLPFVGLFLHLVAIGSGRL